MTDKGERWSLRLCSDGLKYWPSASRPGALGSACEFPSLCVGRTKVGIKGKQVGLADSYSRTHSNFVLNHVPRDTFSSITSIHFATCFSPRSTSSGSDLGCAARAIARRITRAQRRFRSSYGVSAAASSTTSSYHTASLHVSIQNVKGGSEDLFLFSLS